jgi:hypothetical protein
MKAGLISNPLSQQNRKKIERVRDCVRRAPGLAYEELTAIGDIPAILSRFARAGVELVIVNGGDGTVQAVLTSLINDRPFAALPAVAILPMGMTNQIAHDVGLRGRPYASLPRLLRRLETRGARRLHSRPVLSLSDETAPPRHGMFFGNGAFTRGTLLARKEIHPLGVERTAAVGAALGVFLSRALFKPGALQTVYAGETMTMQLDDEPVRRGEALLVMATTLQHGIYGIYPFWGETAAPLRVTRLPFPPERLGRAALPIVFGWERAWLKDFGYISAGGRSLSLQAFGPSMLDGETIETAPGARLRLHAGPAITFVTG